MAKALLIDFDGVLRQWPDLADWPREYEIAEAEIRSVAFTPSLLQQVVLGEIQDEDWRALIVSRLARTHGEGRSKLAVELWSRSAGVLVPEVAGLLRRLSSDFRVVLATYRPRGIWKIAGDIAAFGDAPRGTPWASLHWLAPVT